MFIYLQKVLPTRLLGRLFYKLSRSEIRWLKDLLIRGFIRMYRVDVSEMDKSSPLAYSSFNEFFTRSLKPDARPIAPDPAAICCPSDGFVQQFGHIDEGQLIQAKGMSYRLVDLLGIDSAAEFDGGAFLTIYLAPHNYHRVHAPIGGSVHGVHYIPGKRYAVNEATANAVPGLFAMNERVACFCTGQSTPYWLVFVGAMNVSSISTAWAGEIAPAREPRRWTLAADDSPALNKGDYFGHFNMGSTVIIVFPRDTVTWDSRLRAGAIVRMGREVGRL